MSSKKTTDKPSTLFQEKLEFREHPPPPKKKPNNWNDFMSCYSWTLTPLNLPTLHGTCSRLLNSFQVFCELPFVKAVPRVAIRVADAIFVWSSTFRWPSCRVATCSVCPSLWRWPLSSLPLPGSSMASSWMTTTSWYDTLAAKCIPTAMVPMA